MPNTCRTDTFISGKPETSCALVWTAVVINPPRSRAFPKPDFEFWLRMWASKQISREHGPEEARPRIKVLLFFHRDRYGTRFLEGCPAETAAFPPWRPARSVSGPWHFRRVGIVMLGGRFSPALEPKQ